MATFERPQSLKEKKYIYEVRRTFVWTFFGTRSWSTSKKLLILDKLRKPEMRFGV